MSIRAFANPLRLFELFTFASDAIALVVRKEPSSTQSSDGHLRVVFSERDVAVLDTGRGESPEVSRVGLDTADHSGHLLDRSQIGSGEAILVLPPVDALRRVVQLPVKAARNLRDILRHELDRHSPIDPQQVYFDYGVRIRDKAANRLEVELRIIKRVSIDRAIAVCRSFGLEPIAVEIDGDPAPLNGADLPLKRAAVIRSLWRRWSVPVLAVIIFALAVATTAAVFARRELASSMLDLRVEEAQVKAKDVQRLRAEIAGAEKRAAFLTGEKRGPMAVQVLSELTRTIPDDTWIYSFQLIGREVRIRGFSSAAPTLIGLFETSALFANAQFRAPSTQGPQGGTERFDLSLTVRGAAP